MRRAASSATSACGSAASIRSNASRSGLPASANDNYAVAVLIQFLEQRRRSPGGHVRRRSLAGSVVLVPIPAEAAQGLGLADDSVAVLVELLQLGPDPGVELLADRSRVARPTAYGRLSRRAR